jgi:hypothetical protein
VALFGRNITNEKNLKGVIENYMAAVYNEPRIVGDLGQRQAEVTRAQRFRRLKNPVAPAASAAPGGGVFRARNSHVLDGCA